MMSTSLHFQYGHDMGATRSVTITSVERIWLNALKNCGQDLTKPFHAKTACEWIAGVPTRNGRRASIPNKYKLNYVLRKSPDFERVDKEQRKQQGKRNQWRLIQ